MKKILTSLLLFTAVMMSAQDVPASFPRKFLIEQISGDWCQYCPGGMYAIAEHIEAASTPYIWLCCHSADEYATNKGNQVISFANPNGVPAMMLNRTKQSQGETFHPGYLPEEGLAETIASKWDTVAEASVVIDHTYNAETRELNVTVSGQVANTDVTEYLLSVLIKENGLVGKQADYTYSWKTSGYKEFLHPCVARDFLTEGSTLGDTVKVENQAYSKTFTYTVSDKWVAENCNIVAYITPLTKKPIINAEETTLVAGSTGGTEYQPFGITEIKEPTNVGKLKFNALALNKPSDDKLEIQLVASSTTRSDYYGPVKMVVTLEFNTNDTVIPMDTLEFVAGNELNTFSTGTVDLVEQTFGGSRMQYYLAADMETICHTWRIKNCKCLIDNNGGFLATGNLYNGKYFSITCTLPTTDVEDVVFDKTHVEKLMRDGQFIIRIDDVEYDIQGRIISK